MFTRKVILSTFAGREDRMHNLVKLAEKAHSLGLIDEYHVWDFARADNDRQWLSKMFDVHYTSMDNEFIPINTEDNMFKFTAKGTSYEVKISTMLGALVFTFNSNQVILSINDKQTRSAVIDNSKEICIAWNPNYIKLYNEDNEIMHINFKSSVTYNGVYISGKDVEWSPVNKKWCGLYKTTIKTDSQFKWQDYYKYYYNRRMTTVHNTVLLKVDDDIVYFDIDELRGFIEHRLSNPHYFFTSANVINNGVCAYYQQKQGCIPANIMNLEYPPGGFGGTLWRSPIMFAILHSLFLKQPDAFKYKGIQDIHTRISINMICFLSEDFKYFNNINDDELELSVLIPKYTKRITCIYNPLRACHLTFGTQEENNSELINKLCHAYRVFTQSMIDKIK